MSKIQDDIVDNAGDFRKVLERTREKLSSVKDDRLKILEKADHRVAKNRIAIFVIRSFCLCIFIVFAFIVYGSLFSGSQGWKDAYQPMVDILQKIFLPVVTLAFGFYNSNSGD